MLVRSRRKQESNNSLFWNCLLVYNPSAALHPHSSKEKISKDKERARKQENSVMANYPSILSLLIAMHSIINPIFTSAFPHSPLTPSVPPPSQPSPPSPPPLLPSLSSTSPPPRPFLSPSPPPSTSPHLSPLPPPHSPSFATPSQPSPPPLPRPQQPPPSSLTAQQLKNIIDALIGAGDFTNWANIVSTINPITLPMSATLFIPQEDPLNSGPNMDPFVVPYHIVPQRLSFSELQLLKTGTRLPTLLPGKYILITNNSASNFTLDNSPIIQPDVYTTTAFAVHGIASLLDYSIYGDGRGLLPQPPTHQPEVVIPAPPAQTRDSSDTSCLGSEFPILPLIVCAVWTLKIHGNPLLL